MDAFLNDTEVANEYHFAEGHMWVNTGIKALEGVTVKTPRVAGSSFVIGGFMKYNLTFHRKVSWFMEFIGCADIH